MQRFCALVLAVCMNAFLLLPLVSSAAAAASLPPCCRRSGAHHCSMMGASPSTESTSPSGDNLAPVCPFAHVAKSQAAVRSVSSFAPAQCFFAELLVHPATRPQTEARQRIALVGARQKRGPPSSLNL